jgi:hypothetical protein
MSNLCPVCGRNDNAQRVAVAVASGSASGVASGRTGGIAYAGGSVVPMGGYVQQQVNMTSSLARQLTLPSDPPDTRTQSIVRGILYAALCLLCAYLLVVNLTADANSTLAGLTPFLLLGIALLGFGAYVKFSDYTKVNRDLPKQREMLAIARTRWDRLYICYRDGIVWDPATGEMCQPAETAEFSLYAGLGPSAWAKRASST